MAETGAELERDIKHLSVKESPESEEVAETGAELDFEHLAVKSEDGKKEIAEESTGTASFQQILPSNHTDPVESPNTASLPTPTVTHISHHLPANEVVQRRRITYNKKIPMQYTSNGKPLYIGKCEDGCSKPYAVVVKEAKNSDEINKILEIERWNNNPIVAKLKYHEKHGDTFVMAFAPCKCNIIDHINSLPINDRASTYSFIKDIIMKVKHLHEKYKVCHGDIAYGNIWVSVKDDDVQVMLAGLENARYVPYKQAGHSYGSHPFLDDIKGIKLICYIIMHILANNGVKLHLRHEEVDFETIRLHGDSLTALFHCMADLLRIMSNDPGMSLEDIIRHPFFWEAHDCLSFIRRVRGNLGHQQEFGSMHTKYHVYNMLGVNNWMDKLPEKDKIILEGSNVDGVQDTAILNGIQNLKDYDGERISGLIKYIRNVDCHFFEDMHDINVSVFKSYPKGLVQYINEKFPKLFIYLYRHSQSKRRADAKK